MALDLVVERTKGSPLGTVAIEVAVFGALMTAARKLNAKTLLRLHDYYEDSEIPVAELPRLLKEMTSIREDAGLHGPLSAIADRIASLARLAAQERLPVVAYAD